MNSSVSSKCWRKALWLGLVAVAIVPLARAQAPVVAAPSRITAAVNENNRVTLRGNTHPLARPQFDQGAVADSQPISRMLLLLKRGSDQEAALRSLMDQQQSKSSPSYHQWLTPQQFGQQFGPSDADVATVTEWLQSHGFQVSRVSAGRTVIEFSGNAGQVRGAFNTEIHRFVVNGEEHLANASDPQIPAALAPVVAGPVSLHNFPKKAQSRVRGTFSKDKETGKVKPLFTGNNESFFALGPADFNKIYTVPAGATGSGQTIAIVGDSEICTQNSPDFNACASDDVAAFRSLFGLPAKSPNIILDGPDPGFNGDETEGDLDVQWSGGIAPAATIDFVIAQDTESTFGVDLAAEYAVDNNLAPVLSESFGACEAALGQAADEFYDVLWEQAAAQGMTVIVSAGDSGAAGCDNDITQSFAETFGVGVNGIASTPFNVSAGGTDFDVTLPTAATYASTYWNAQNAAGGESAKSYIPETTWDDSCAQSLTNPPSLTGCSPPSDLNLLNIVGGGGGHSNCVNPAFTPAGNFIACEAISQGSALTGYPKPSWQSGPYVTGLASTDNVRDSPDISLFAADGMVSNSFYAICQSDANASCIPVGGSVAFIGVGGTSSSAPAFAGIMASVNQSTGARQGNANYVLYPLATMQNGASCNSSTGPNNANPLCTFNDVTKGNNSVPCLGGSFDCSVANAGNYGVLESNGALAFNTGTGYDLATGLGTINVNNLLANWSKASFTGTTTTLCMVVPPANTCATPPAAVQITHGSPVNVIVAVTPSPGTNSAAKPETVSLIGMGTFGNSSTAGVDEFTSNDYVLSNADVHALTSGSSSFSTVFLVGGTYTVQARYAGDGMSGASLSAAPGISVTVTPEPTTTTVSAGLLNFTNSSINSISGLTVFYGDAIPLRADVVGKTSGQESATGTVTFMDNGAPIGSSTLNTEGYAEDQTGANADQVSTNAALGLGSHTISASYSGDNSYCASNACGSTVGSSVSFNVEAAPTTIGVSAGTSTIQQGTSITIPSGTNVTLQAFVDTLSSSALSSGGSSGNNLAGTVTFSCTPVVPACGASTPAASFTGTADSSGFVAGMATLNIAPTTTTTVSAAFTPTGANYGSSTTMASATVNVSSSSFTLAPLPLVAPTINIGAPGLSGNTSITVASAGFSGNVSLTCAVVPVVLNTVTNQPTCLFTLNGTANNTVVLTGTGSNGQRLLVVNTTAATALLGPTRPPQGPNNVILPAAATSLVGLALLFFVPWGIPARRRGMALLGALIVLVAITGVSCGGGSGIVGNSGGGGSGGGNAGTTVTSYTVTVTATATGGPTEQTTVQVNVN